VLSKACVTALRFHIFADTMLIGGCADIRQGSRWQQRLLGGARGIILSPWARGS